MGACAGLVKPPIGTTGLPADPKYVKLGQLIVTLAKAGKQIDKFTSSDKIKFEEIWELVNTVFQISNTISQLGGADAAAGVTRAMSGLMELKTKIQSPEKCPTIKVVDVLIPSANALSGLINLTAEACPDKKGELTKIQEGIDFSNGQLEKQRKGVFGEMELANEFAKKKQNE